MFKYTKKDIVKYAVDYKVKKNTLEKVLRLVDILEFINNDDSLFGKLSLKGGTSINLVYYNYLRLSVDIDLDYVGSLNKKTMISDRENIEKKLLAYVESNNMHYRADKSRKTHALDSFVFNYNNLFNSSDMLKIEINYMNREHLFDCEYRNITLPTANNVKVLSLNKYDLFASKTNALIYRTTIRDIYDVNNMILLKTISDEEISTFRKSLLFYLLLSSEKKLNIDELLNQCVTRMNSFCNKRLPQYLTSTLKVTDNFDVNFAVTTIKEFIYKVRESITSEELMFIDSFPSIKNKLFDDDSINEKINRHPMINWKQKKYN